MTQLTRILAGFRVRACMVGAGGARPVSVTSTLPAVCVRVRPISSTSTNVGPPPTEGIPPSLQDVPGKQGHRVSQDSHQGVSDALDEQGGERVRSAKDVKAPGASAGLGGGVDAALEGYATKEKQYTPGRGAEEAPGGEEVMDQKSLGGCEGITSPKAVNRVADDIAEEAVHDSGLGSRASTASSSASSSSPSPPPASSTGAAAGGGGGAEGKKEEEGVITSANDITEKAGKIAQDVVNATTQAAKTVKGKVEEVVKGV